MWNDARRVTQRSKILENIKQGQRLNSRQIGHFPDSRAAEPKKYGRKFLKPLCLRFKGSILEIQRREIKRRKENLWMWDERKKENISSKTPDPTTPANPVGPLNKGVGPRTTGVLGPDVAFVGQEMTIRGQIQSRQDMYVDGDVQGTLELLGYRLTIGPSGKVEAGAKAREIIVLGAISGDVEATERISIREGGRLIGDIRTSGIVIEDGAYFKGSIDIVKREADAADANG